MAFTKTITELISEDTSGLLGKHPSWERVLLGEVANVINGYAFSSSFFNATGKGLPLIRIRDVVSGATETYYDGPYENEYLVHSGDLLVGMDGDFNCAYWRSEKALLNQRVCKVDLTSEYYEQKLLSYVLPHFLDAINQHTSSMTVKHLSSKTINDIQLPLPPRNEQTRIVEKLEELLSDLDNGVAELKAAQAKLTQYRQSLLKSAVEGSLTAEWRSQNTPGETGAQLLDRILKERRQRWEQQKLAEFKTKNQKPPKDWQKKYPEPVKPDTSDLPELPEGWVWASVDQCTKEAKDITDGPFGSNLKTAHYTDAGPRVIRLQNIGDGEFFDDKAHISSSHYEKLLKHAFETGDTVIAMMGEILPRACSIPNGVAPGIVKADCARVRVNSEVLEPNLLPYFLNSQPIRNETKSLVKGIGRPRINLSHIRSMAIPIASCQEQMQILAAIRSGQDSIDRQSDELSKALVSLNAQRKNILKDAFSGRLVEQDLNDEPASVLLEKIKAERALKEKQPKPKSSKKKAPPKVKQMPKLEDILKTQSNWIEAQQLFRECGISDNAETDQVEALYGELRDLDQANRLDIKREWDVDFIKLKAESVE